MKRRNFLKRMIAIPAIVIGTAQFYGGPAGGSMSDSTRENPWIPEDYRLRLDSQCRTMAPITRDFRHMNNWPPKPFRVKDWEIHG